MEELIRKIKVMGTDEINSLFKILFYLEKEGGKPVSFRRFENLRKRVIYNNFLLMEFVIVAIGFFVMLLFI